MFFIVLKFLEDKNKKWNNFFGFNLDGWALNFYEKIRYKTDLLSIIYEKYRDMLGMGDKYEYDSQGNLVLKKNNMPELSLLSFMA